LLMQIQADLLEAEVIRPQTTETTALGAAFFAGLATGYWESVDSLKTLWAVDQKFTPNADSDTQKTIELWKKRIAKLSTYAP